MLYGISTIMPQKTTIFDDLLQTKQKKYKSANLSEDLFKFMIDHPEDDAAAQVYLGHLFEQKNQWDKALEAYQKCDRYRSLKGCSLSACNYASSREKRMLDLLGNPSAQPLLPRHPQPIQAVLAPYLRQSTAQKIRLSSQPLRSEEITKSAASVLASVAELTDEFGIPTKRDIARRQKCTLRSVNTSLSELKSWEYVDCLADLQDKSEVILLDKGRAYLESKAKNPPLMPTVPPRENPPQRKRGRQTQQAATTQIVVNVPAQSNVVVRVSPVNLQTSSQRADASQEPLLFMAQKFAPRGNRPSPSVLTTASASASKDASIRNLLN